MPKKKMRFADDGWAVWIDGDDTSTIYINDWLNPKGKSYVDFAVRVRGMSVSRAMHVYIPFAVSMQEIEDISLKFHDEKILQAIFSFACIVDYKKNERTSEIAYNGKTIDICHISAMNYTLKCVANGTLLSLDFKEVLPYVDNDEAYFIWRMPHRSLDEIFKPQVNVGNMLKRLRDLITTPVAHEKYGYSVRVNESRLLPEGINRIGAVHRQKLKKAVVSISIHEGYELKDTGCYRIHRLEEQLYEEFLPEGYRDEDVITYQWNQTREYNLFGHFNFYFNISKESVSRASVVVYLILLLVVGAAGNAIYELFEFLIRLL